MSVISINRSPTPVFGSGDDPSWPPGRPEPVAPVPGAIALIVERRHLGDEAIQDLQLELAAAGRAVQTVIPEPGRLFDLPAAAPSWSAVLSRGRAPAVLALLAAASALDVLTINTPRAVDLVRSKVGMQAMLARHGVPMPRAWFAADPAAFRDVPAEWFPLVVKPFDDDGAAGPWLLTGPDDVALLPSADRSCPPYVARQLLASDGWVLKLYGIGSDVWAVRTPDPVRFAGPGPGAPGPAAPAQLVPLDAELRDIALTCGRACGLELWGVDVAMTPRGPAVIEVADFPAYAAVPDAGARIARHILALTGLDALMRSAGNQRQHTLLRVVS